MRVVDPSTVLATHISELLKTHVNEIVGRQEVQYLLDKVSEVVRMEEIDSEPEDPFALVLDLGAEKKKRRIYFERPDVSSINAIKEELASFKESIVNNTTPLVNIEDGYMALKIAQMVMDKIDSSFNNL